MIDVSQHPVLYSAGTLLAYKIAKKYYHDVHYVWCTTNFDDYKQPGSSNPKTICNRYLDQAIKHDGHGAELERNRVGIINGAKEKYKERIITKQQLLEIQAIVDSAEYESFIPVLYIITTEKVNERVEGICDKYKASNTSVEYRITDLCRVEFTLINFYDILQGVVDFNN